MGGYSVRLEQKSFKKSQSCEANLRFFERFLRFLFKTYQLSLFPLFIPGHALPPMAQAYGLSVAIPLFHASGLAMPDRITKRSQNDPKTTPKRFQSDPKTIPK